MKLRRTTSPGFTIVEIIVVVVTLGILTTLVVAGYGNYQQTVKQTTAKNDLARIHSDIEKHKARTGQYPSSLSSIDTSGIQSEADIDYKSFPSLGWFCVSMSINDSAFFNNSLNSTVQEGDCDDIKSVVGQPAGFVDDPQDTVKSVELTSPLTGYPDVTAYVVFDIFDVYSSYQSFVRLTPSLNSQQVFGLDLPDAGLNSLRYRIDTSAQSNAVSSQIDVRTPGRHLGWLQVRDELTVREFAYDKVAAHSSLSLSPGDGWNFTGMYIVASVSSQKAVAAVVYNAAHDENMRKIVMTWLADKYEVPLSL